MLSENHPIIRRILRFCALPYCYLRLVNWKECTASRFQVIKDLLFIFFKLKYYPDNYSKCRLWELPRDEWNYYYGSVYNPWPRWWLRKEVFPIKYRILYDDKNICFLLCKANQLPVPVSHGIVRKANFKDKIAGILAAHPGKQLIVKPLEGRGGKDIILVTKQNGEISIKEQDNIYSLTSYQLPYVSVLQEYIDQHKDISAFSKSVNTIRIVTMLTKSDEVIILGARMRIGIGTSFLDNTCQGGVAVNISVEEGTLGGVAYDNKGIVYHTHPTSNIPFKNFKIPYWQEVLTLAEKVQKRLSYNKLLGQDIAISEKGPVIIELNAEYDNVMFEQACGPLLKNKIVREEFGKYNLLINKYQKNLIKK